MTKEFDPALNISLNGRMIVHFVDNKPTLVEQCFLMN